MNCNHCQEQLLHYLYDVLEAEERTQIVAHLEGCAACQSARESLRAQQELLAEAAKVSFAQVAFQPPAETPKRFGEPTLAMPRRQRGFSWVRVAVAATIIVFVFGGGSMGVLGWLGSKDELQVAEAKVREAKKQSEDFQLSVQKHQKQTQVEMRAVQEQINRLFDEWTRDATKVRKEHQEKPGIRVHSPSNMPAGAQAPLRFDVTNLQGPPGAAKKTIAQPTAQGNDFDRATIKVFDPSNNKTIAEHELRNVQERNPFKLPPLAIPPGTNWALQVDLLKDGKVGASEIVNLSAPEYLTHLMTDRPMYRPNEVVRFRSLTLERFSLKPVQEDLQLVYKVLGPNQQEIFKLEGAATLVTDQNKDPIQGPDGKPLRGLGAGEFALPVDLPGGQYTISVSEGQNRFPPEKRSFLVSQWQMPRMNKELKFHRSSYGPGEVVEVQALAKRGEDGKAPLAGQPAHVKASVDGIIMLDERRQTDAEGKVRLVFKLPAELLRQGQGAVSVEFHDGAGPETIVKPIPIVLNRLHVDFFPEGGDLIQGVSNRVYFQARDTIARPAELKGRLVDQQGDTVANLETLHDDQEEGINQGQGSFSFVPVAGKRYELKIDAPLGVTSKDVFPATKAKGVVLRLMKPLAEQTIELEVTSADTQRLLMVGAYCRGRLLDQRQIGAPAGKPVPVTLNTEPGVSGVYRVTVYEIIIKGDDIQYVPRAERLTYRPSDQRLNVALDGAKDAYFPGERVKLRLKAHNEANAKTPAIALVSVVDLSLIKLVDDKTDRLMPTHFLLTNEIRKPEDFENADVLLGSHAKAAAALDLLLGTQGWRRFAEQDPVRFQQLQPREAQRILTTLATPNERRDSLEQIVGDKVDKGYAVKAIPMLEKLALHEAEENGPLDAPVRQAGLVQSVLQADRGLEDARASLRDYEFRMFQYMLGAVVIGALLLGLGAIGLGVRRLGQGRSALATLVTGTALLLFLFMGSLAGVFYMIGSRGEPIMAWNQPKIEDAPLNMAVAPQWAGQDAAPPMAGPPPDMMEKKEFADAKIDKQRMVADNMLAKGALDDRNLVEQAKAGQPRAMVKMAAAAPAAPAAGRGAPPGVQLNAMPQPGGFGGAGLPPGAQGLAQGGGQFDAQMRQNLFNNLNQGANFAGERELRQKKDYGEILLRRTGRVIELPPVVPPLVVREYAHEHLETPDSIRRDFTETLCWRPALVLPGGEAEFGFDLSDAVTRYQVTVFSHSLDGRLGANRFELAARLPFSIDPKAPFEISNTDTVIIPVAVRNDTEQNGRVELIAKFSGVKEPQTHDVLVNAKDRSRGLFTYAPALVSGEATLRVKGTLNGNQFGSDTVERSFKIVPDGFPISGSASGLLEKATVHEIMLPNTWVAGTLQFQVQVFPSTLAELQKGLEGLLREPCGCFEQSSSSNYPNVLILNYLQEAGQGDPNIEKRARGLLASGYQKLTSFECLDPNPPGSPPSQGGARGGETRRGYEWFGQTAPPHEALTAYGLLQFRDMAKVYNVDAAMVQRTRKYLLAQRDGQGGFLRNARALDSFGRAPDHITSAYIVWALTDSGGDEDLSKELTALAAKAKDSKDPYFVALVALGHLGGGKSDDALLLAKKLKDVQKDDGHLEGTETSITGSQGRDLHLESTALAVLAWLKANRPEEFHTSIQKAVKWISAQRSGQGSFGATQSTILALKALIAHTRDSKKVAEDGKLTLTLPGLRDAPVAETSFTAGAAEPITLTLLDGKGLQPGKNKVLVEITGKNTFPYTLGWSYQTLTPPSDVGCPVKLTTRLDKFNVQEGDTVKLHASVQNTADKGHGMAIAIIGLPAGLALPEDFKQLKEMAKLRDNGTKPGTISHWEVRGRELILYWRDLAPQTKIDVAIDLVSRLPGTYRGPASRAYLYYSADRKAWAEPLSVVIDPQRAD